MEWILFIAAASFSTLGTLAGFGGGIFLIPLMVVAFHIPIEMAIGVTALSLFPSSVISTAFNVKRGNIDYRLLAALGPATVVGAIVGAHITSLLPTQPLEYAFSGFLVLMAWKTYRPTTTPTVFSKGFRHFNEMKPLVVDKEYKVGLIASIGLGAFAGFIAGLFGIGGGILITPLMISVFKVPVRIATGTAIGMILFTSFSSGWTHYHLGHSTWDLLIPCGLGFATGGLIGSLLGIRFKDEVLQKVIAGSILAASIAILI